MRLLFSRNLLASVFALTAGLCPLLTGCAGPPIVELAEICPGKSDVASAVAALDASRERLKPMRASGKCVLKFNDSKGKSHTERLDIQLRTFPPDRIFFTGSTLLGEAVRLGTSREEFWLMMKPKEISAYWWGRREHAGSSAHPLWLNPDALLEAIGAVKAGPGWTLANRGGLDILTKRDPSGTAVKKIFIGCCDYRVRRIEYYDADGNADVVVELSDYTDTDEITVPKRITITSGEGDDPATTDITLASVRAFKPTDAQLKGLFTRPEPKGIKNIFELNKNGRFVRQ